MCSDSCAGVYVELSGFKLGCKELPGLKLRKALLFAVMATALNRSCTHLGEGAQARVALGTIFVGPEVPCEELGWDGLSHQDDRVEFATELAVLSGEAHHEGARQQELLLVLLGRRLETCRGVDVR